MLSVDDSQLQLPLTSGMTLLRWFINPRYRPCMAGAPYLATEITYVNGIDFSLKNHSGHQILIHFSSEIFANGLISLSIINRNITS